jgi:hypothetical protein
MADNGCKYVTLSSSIITETESAESSTVAVISTFKDGRDLLADWHCIAERMFPKHPDILAMIPNPSRLKIGKLNDSGSIMTDTCNKATKQRGLTMAVIKSAAMEMGINKSDVK